MRKGTCPAAAFVEKEPARELRSRRHLPGGGRVRRGGGVRQRRERTDDDRLRLGRRVREDLRAVAGSKIARRLRVSLNVSLNIRLQGNLIRSLQVPRCK